MMQAHLKETPQFDPAAFVTATQETGWQIRVSLVDGETHGFVYVDLDYHVDNAPDPETTCFVRGLPEHDRYALGRFLYQQGHIHSDVMSRQNPNYRENAFHEYQLGEPNKEYDAAAFVRKADALQFRYSATRLNGKLHGLSVSFPVNQITQEQGWGMKMLFGKMHSIPGADRAIGEYLEAKGKVNFWVHERIGDQP